jgi:pre-mRNA-splicing factor RBM22/SLT11
MLNRHDRWQNTTIGITRQYNMPPQIKQDLNRSGWESTDFPSVCENCLPNNPYVKMLKEDYGAECKMVCHQPLS